MNTPTDAASSVAAKVASESPAPAALGLLRFERLNSASWTLLFLDPACLPQLGLPAQDLCGLGDCAYADLLEADQRTALHDDIQRQLAGGGRYRVCYPLHTPLGVQRVEEFGEVVLQHRRQILRGYLLLGSPPPAEPARLPSAGSAHPHPTRLRAQQNLIVRLARHRYRSHDPLREAAELITRAACETYAVARASIWMLSEQGELQAFCLYREGCGHDEHPPTLDASRFPRYLEALHSGRAIAAHDAQLDPRTRELSECYLKPLQIGAILDASIRSAGEVVAILSLEHVGTARVWQSDEIAFAGELADQFSQVLINQQRRSAANALHLFRRAVDQSASAFILINRDGLVEYVNPSFTAITQYSSAEVCGRRLTDLPALDTLGDLLFDAQASLAQESSWQGELKSRRKNLEPYWGHLSISKVLDEDGALTHYIGIYEDITASKRAQQRIEKLAYTDSVTHMGNRPFLIRCLEERLQKPDDVPLSLLLVDIDNFKRINDSLGHQTGDKLLSSLARRLRNSLSPGDTLARFASNEFGILLDGIDLDSALQTAQQLLRTLDKPLFVDNQLISVTASIGLACAPAHGRDPKTLLQHAGLALHKAKANGKHQLQVFTDALNAEASYKLFLENNLRRALEHHELEVFYQPKLCLVSGRLLGLEALLRWNHPDRGMIRPDQFIGVAEETGMILPIGKWVLREACRQLRRLARGGFPRLQVAINLSPRQFSDPDLVGSIAGILAEEGVDAAQLELELTESLLLDATEDTRRQLVELKALGLSLAMDDFGTGYSSLSYLKKFPIDVIKVDRSFVKDIPANQDDMEIVSAVIAMAHKLNIKVVAEGIESNAQLLFLRRQRCDIGQGYLFDQPIAGRRLLDELRRYPA